MSEVQKVRKVTIMVNSDSSRHSLTTAATTWGELKSEIQSELGEAIGNVEKKKFVERESKSTFENDEITLPTENFFLFAYAKESKGGIDLKSANYNELRSYGSRLNKENGAELDLSGNTEELRARLIAYENGNGATVKTYDRPPTQQTVKENTIDSISELFAGLIEQERAEAIEEYKAQAEKAQADDSAFKQVVAEITDGILQEAHQLEKSAKSLKKLVSKYSDDEVDIEELKKEAMALRPAGSK